MARIGVDRWGTPNNVYYNCQGGNSYCYPLCCSGKSFCHGLRSGTRLFTIHDLTWSFPADLSQRSSDEHSEEIILSRIYAELYIGWGRGQYVFQFTKRNLAIMIYLDCTVFLEQHSYSISECSNTGDSKGLRELWPRMSYCCTCD